MKKTIPDPLPALLTIPVAAVMMSTSVYAIRRLCRDNKLKFVTIGHSWLISPDSIQEFIRQNEHLKHSKPALVKNLKGNRKLPIVQMLTDRDLQREYGRLNRAYFGDELPKDLVVEFVPIAELDGDWGEYEDGAIRINETLKEVPDFAYIVLLHEMAHVKHPASSHGLLFGSVIVDLFQKGAYDDLL